MLSKKVRKSLGAPLKILAKTDVYASLKEAVTSHASVKPLMAITCLIAAIVIIAASVIPVKAWGDSSPPGMNPTPESTVVAAADKDADAKNEMNNTATEVVRDTGETVESSTQDSQENEVNEGTDGSPSEGEFDGEQSGESGDGTDSSTEGTDSPTDVIEENTPGETEVGLADEAEPRAPRTVTVNKAGSRDSNGNPVGLAGATFIAVPSADRANVPALPTDTTGLPTCVSQAGGVCTLTLESTLDYWVLELAAPDGWEVMDTVALGAVSSGGTTNLTQYTYAFWVGRGTSPVSLPNSDNATHLPATGGSSSNDYRSTSGFWPNVKKNPEFPQQCLAAKPLKVALLIDQSSSINAEEELQLEESAKAFVDPVALGLTKTEVGVFTFGTDAAQKLAATSVETQGGIDTVQQAITDLTGPVGSQYTNWDRAFRFVAAADTWDAVMVLTDGDPTAYWSSSGAQTQQGSVYTSLQTLEQAVFSANALKEKGTAVLSVGIGMGANSIANLRAISGENDVYVSEDFVELRSLLHQIAQRAQCQATVRVQKQIPDNDGEGSGPYPGWPMTVSLSSPDGTPRLGEGESQDWVPVSNPSTKETALDAAGENAYADWVIQFNHPRGETADLTISEAMRDGYEFVDVVYYIIHADGTWDVPVQITDPEQATLLLEGITPAEQVVVVYRNTPVDTKGSVYWRKVDENGELLGGSTWNIASPNGTDITILDNSVRDLNKNDGEFLVENLDTGLYALKEVEAPAGYEFDEEEYSFPIYAGVEHHVATKDFVNRRIRGTVTWTKADENGGYLSGTSWEMTTPGGQKVLVTDCVATDASGCTGSDKNPGSGQFKVEDLDWGDYQLVEAENPDGYVLDTRVHSFTISAYNLDQVFTLAFVNVPPVIPTLPLTGGMSSDSFYIVGGIVLVVTLAAAGGEYLRRRKVASAKDEVHQS